MKIIYIPSGGLVKDNLVKKSEELSEEQILIVLDNETLEENVNSLENQIKQKRAQLEFKKEEKIKSNDLYTSKLNSSSQIN